MYPKNKRLHAGSYYRPMHAWRKFTSISRLVNSFLLPPADMRAAGLTQGPADVSRASKRRGDASHPGGMERPQAGGRAGWCRTCEDDCHAVLLSRHLRVRSPPNTVHCASQQRCELTNREPRRLHRPSGGGGAAFDIIHATAQTRHGLHSTSTVTAVRPIHIHTYIKLY